VIAYEDNIEFVCQRMAFVYLCRHMEKHPELEVDFEAQQALFRRAFCPAAYAKFAKKAASRGIELRRGKSPTRRPTEQRHIDRFMRGLQYTIETAAARFEGKQ
jgi:hypothetical protein